MWRLSPLHDESNLPSQPMCQWSIDLMIEIFRVSTDVWYLEVAQRCINPWYDEQGEPIIKANDVRGNPVNHIPDSGWAVLQIMCIYFETVGYFASGGDEKKGSGYRFRLGVERIFPELVNQPKVIDVLWSHLRGRLYHAGPVRETDAKKAGQVFLSIGYYYPALATHQHSAGVEVLINPHKLVEYLRKHLRNYCEHLSDTAYDEERTLFRDAFLLKYDQND